jgi:hypothetical protein
VPVFIDNFAGALNDPIEGRSGWTRNGGIAGGAAINASNAAKAVDTAGTGYFAPDTGSPDHYCSAKVQAANFSAMALCIGMQDRNNIAACLRFVPGVEIRSRTSGTFSAPVSFGTIPGGHNPADVWTLQRDNGVGQLFRNGVQFGTDFDASLFPTETKVGFVARTAVYDPFLDDWQSDALTGSGTIHDGAAEAAAGATAEAGATLRQGVSASAAGGATAEAAPIVRHGVAAPAAVSGTAGATGRLRIGAAAAASASATAEASASVDGSGTSHQAAAEAACGVTAAAAARLRHGASASAQAGVVGSAEAVVPGATPTGPVVARVAVVRLIEATAAVVRLIQVQIAIEGNRLMAQKQLVVGEAVELRLTLITPAGVPVTGASGVTVKARPQAGTVRTYAVSPGAAPGEWVATVLLDLPGRWWLSGECSGPTPAIAEVPVEVFPRAVS